MNDATGHGRFRPGFVFKDGKAYEFERDRLTIMRPWPAPAAWRLTPKATAFRHVLPRLELARVEGWARPEFVEEVLREMLGGRVGEGSEQPSEEASEEASVDPRLVERLRHGYGARQAAAGRFLDAIPAPVRSIVRRFDRTQWQMLTFLGRVPGGLDLATTNPVLAWALAMNPSFHRPRVRQPLRAARTWVNRPRARIAGWLGFPATTSAVKLLAKVEPSAAAVVPLFTLRRIAREGGQQLTTLQHLPRIHAAALECVGRTTLMGMVTGAFVGELARLDPEDARDRLRLLKDARRMCTWLGEDPVRVSSLARLAPIHDELIHRVNHEIHSAPSEARLFPRPPIPGTDAIEPLLSLDDLRHEGREMQHCVATFEDWIASGKGHVYRVLVPERATLSIEPDHTGSWRISQLKAIRNLPVEPETTAAVKRWLRGEPEPQPPIDLTPMFPQFLWT